MTGWPLAEEQRAPDGSSPSTVAAEFHDLLESAYRGGAFEVRTLAEFIKSGAFPECHSLLQALHTLGEATQHVLAELVGTPQPNDTSSDEHIDDYVTLISRLDRADLIAAIVSLGQAALCRLYRLRTLAPQSTRSILDALIDHEKVFVASAQYGIVTVTAEFEC